MVKISAIVCILVILLSTGLVSGDGIATESHPNAYSQTSDLQVNVDNINGYPVANVYVYVDGEERALTCPFGYAYIEGVPYSDHHIDIRYSITNPDYSGNYQRSLDITVDEEKEVVNFIATLPDRSQLAQAQSLGDSSNFTRIENFTPQILPVAAVAMAVIDIASVTWSTDEFCRCMFQEEGSSGIEQCINAITDCGGDTRGCIREIRENAGPAANRCKFEGAMLVGDVASPFIPVGFVGHGVAAVVGEGRVLKIADNIGEHGRIVNTKAGGVVEYVKDGVSWTAKWVEGAGFKLGIIHYVSWWDELSQPALDGWNKALKNVDRGTGKELLDDLGKGRADRAGRNLAGMSDDAAEWMLLTRSCITDYPYGPFPPFGMILLRNAPMVTFARYARKTTWKIRKSSSDQLPE